jgi:hypothetical protein
MSCVPVAMVVWSPLFPSRNQERGATMAKVDPTIQYVVPDPFTAPHGVAFSMEIGTAATISSYVVLAGRPPVVARPNHRPFVTSTFFKKQFEPSPLCLGWNGQNRGAARTIGSPFGRGALGRP